MPTLLNFPMVSQLADTSEANRLYDCVPACLAASLQWLTGSSFDAGMLKDAVYGAGYVGPTDAWNFHQVVWTHDCILWKVQASELCQISLTKLLLAAQVPVILTERDPYASSGTHAVVAFAANHDSITVMDPYIKNRVTHTDSLWYATIYGQTLYYMEKRT